MPNRWYGRGVAEKLLTMQIYANIVFNVRINRSRMSQLGIFKMKKGAGITAQMLARLPSNGVVVLNNMDDLQQMVVQEVGQTSYTDEQVINTISERLTNAFEIVTGEALPSSTPATNAAIQNQNAKSGFALIKDSIGGFLERWMDRHALPIIAKELTTGAVVRFASDDDTFKQLVDRIVLSRAQEALDASFAKGYLPTEQEINSEIDRAKEKMLKGDLFINLLRDVIASELFTEVYVTNEEMDVSVTIQNLLNMLRVAPQYQDAIVKQTFDLMGLQQPKTPAQPQQMTQGGQVPQMQSPIPQGQMMQQGMTNALTK